MRLNFLFLSICVKLLYARTCFDTPETCPFNDLSGDEITKAISIVKSSGVFPSNSDLKFPIVSTKEPDKQKWLNGEIPSNSRIAYVAVFDFKTNHLVEFDVDLLKNQILYVNFKERGTSPPVMAAEYAIAEQIIKSDPHFIPALKNHGITNLEHVRLDVWAPGPLSSFESSPDRRLLRGIFNYQDPDSRFLNYRVIEGLIFTVDLVSKSVVEIVDNDHTNITSTLKQSIGSSDKPKLNKITVSQPEGVSFKIHGQQIEWYKWKFMYSIDPVTGLQLFHVYYNGDCQDRSVLYKMSLAEMFVPYGAKGKNWRWRSAFDAGEYGIGNYLNPLKIGLDVPSNGLLVNCTLANENGLKPKYIEGCMGVYEKDIGMLYKHSSEGNLDIDGRKGRVLVLTLLTTVSNYDYTFDYIFQMDGTIDVQSRLTGIILARGVHDRENSNDCAPDSCKNYLNDYLIGPTHQHWYNYRIDFDIDGTKNWVAEANVENEKFDPIENPDDSAFSTVTTLIPDETYRDYDFESNRNWHIINMNSRNRFNTPRGYAIIPGTISYSFLSPNHPFSNRASFIRHPIWFTKYHHEEQYTFPRTVEKNTTSEGLLSFIDLENLEGKDIVTWFSFGVTHSTRPEEWPIMNIHQAGFKIMPFNFLSQNSEMTIKGRCS